MSKRAIRRIRMWAGFDEKGRLCSSAPWATRGLRGAYPAAIYGNKQAALDECATVHPVVVILPAPPKKKGKRT